LDLRRENPLGEEDGALVDMYERALERGVIVNMGDDDGLSIRRDRRFSNQHFNGPERRHAADDRRKA